MVCGCACRAALTWFRICWHIEHLRPPIMEVIMTYQNGTDDAQGDLPEHLVRVQPSSSAASYRVGSHTHDGCHQHDGGVCQTTSGSSSGPQDHGCPTRYSIKLMGVLIQPMLSSNRVHRPLSENRARRTGMAKAEAMIRFGHIDDRLEEGLPLQLQLRRSCEPCRQQQRDTMICGTANR